ncbi:hypothetical protein NEMBOFW57_002472 [Staphylotrichum longicolle]|uniref:Uncharacterized protein n=1 Tax=Staphylotrichum longicolle TaxID=669026 RepID=A0AAD4F3E4_9PEZI|nr:hypothetical protein NEMBOFW57_002472 [Staphylotrichum longicolle]
MDSTFVVVALAGLYLFAVGTGVPSANANAFEVMEVLFTEQQSMVDYVHLGTIIFTFASLLARLFVLSRGCLPTIASRINLILDSSSAGATRRVTLAREAATSAAWGFINALRSVTLAGILSGMLGRFVLPLLLLVLRPFIPAILRKYFLWRNWVEARFGDFVDFVCVDMRKRAERRRVCKARELVYGVQVARLEKLNAQVAALVRKAETTFSDARFWFDGKYDHLRPTEFAGRVAVVVPEEGPIPALGLWFRLRHRVDMGVHWADQTIRRIESADARNQEGIANLQHQWAFRSCELRAIEDQVQRCKVRARETFRLAHAERRLINSPIAQPAPESRRREKTALPRHTTTTSVSAPPADVSRIITTIPAAVDSPGSANIPNLPPPSPPAPHPTKSRRIFPALLAAPSPTPEETPTAATVTIIDTRTAEQIAVADAMLSALAAQRIYLAQENKRRAAEAAEREQRRLAPPTHRWLTNREWFAALPKAEQQAIRAKSSANNNTTTSKTDILRAEAEAAARRREAQAEANRVRAEAEAKLRAATETRQSEEAALESALAEERKLNGSAAANTPEPSLKGKGEAVVESVEVTRDPEASLERRATVAETQAAADEPEPARAEVKAVRFELPNDPEPSLEGRGRVEAEEAHEPEKAVAGEPADEPETAVLESLAEEPNPEVEQGEAKADVDSITDEPELPLEGTVKVDDNLVADEPEASLERTVSDDATATNEPALKFFSEEEAKVTVAAPAESETETSYEEEVTMTAGRLAEPIPEVEQGEGRMSEPTLADEPMSESSSEQEDEVKVECASLADEPMSESSPEQEDSAVKAEPLAHELETAQHMLAQGPETAECPSLADVSMSEASPGAEDETMAEQEFSLENIDPMLLDAPAEMQQRVDTEMAELGRLDAIRDQIRAAQAQANHLNELQRAEAQRREWEEERARDAALDQARQQRVWHWEQAQPAEIRRGFEEERVLQTDFAARLDGEKQRVIRDELAARSAEDDTRLTQVDTETASAEEVDMLDASRDSDPEAGVSEAEMSESEDDDEDTSLNDEELQEMRPTFRILDSLKHLEFNPFRAAEEQLPTTTPATATQEPSTCGQATSSTSIFQRVAQPTIPEAIPSAEQGLAGPAYPAARKVLPARGTRGANAAMLAAARKERESQATRARAEAAMREELSPEFQALVAEVEEEWDAELEAGQAQREAEAKADPKGKGKAAVRAAGSAEARAKARLEFQQIEDDMKRAGEGVQRSIEQSFSQETIFRPLELGEEALFDPRAKRAYAEASNAYRMGVAAEEAQRSAQTRESNMAEVSDEDEEEEEAESAEDAERKAAEEEAQRVEDAEQRQTHEADARADATAARPVAGAKVNPLAKRNLVSAEGVSDADDTDDESELYAEGARKRADKPETDKNAQDKPFIPQYGPETFSSSPGRVSLNDYLAIVRGSRPAPAPVPSPSPIPMVSAPSPVAAVNTASPSNSPRPGPTNSSLTPLRMRNTPSPRSSPRPPPSPGTVIVMKPAPSLFIERKKPKKPTPKPGQT